MLMSIVSQNVGINGKFAGEETMKEMLKQKT